MDSTRHNPGANVPEGDTPQGDLGERGKTWSPGEEQGISNRVGDEAENRRSDDDDEFQEDEGEQDEG